MAKITKKSHPPMTPQEVVAAKEKSVEAAREKLRQEKTALADAKRMASAQEAEQKRKDDTRRKILIGALMLAESEHDEQVKAYLDNLVKTLKRADERALFGLDPLPFEPTESAAQAPENALPEGPG